jgi:hypothetical protein
VVRQNDVTAATKRSRQRALEAELERLKRLLQLGYELKVLWLPNNHANVAGEVKGDYIYVYDDDREAALETLKHEFVDYAISRVVEPYKDVANRLVALVNDLAYRRKEQLVEALVRTLEVCESR